MARPELTSAIAEVSLPEYLGLPTGADERRPRRRALAGERKPRAVHRDGEPRVGPFRRLTDESNRRRATRSPARRSACRVPKLEFRWQDRFGLAGQEPFTLSITGREDEAPLSRCEDLPRQKVVLDSELLSFKVRAQDDFGIKRIGIEWQGIDDPIVSDDRPRASASSPPAAHDKEIAGGQRHVLGQVAGHRAAAGPASGSSSRTISRARPRIYSPTVHSLRPECRAARHLGHRAVEQVASPVARGPRPRNAAVRDEQAASRALPPKSSTGPRPGAASRTRPRPSGPTAGGLSHLVIDGRRPDQAGDAQPGVRRRPSREMGRDAPDPEGHRGQPDAVGRRPAQAGGPGADRHGRARSNNKTMMAGQIRAIAPGKPASSPTKPPTQARSRRAFRRSSIGIVAAAARQESRPARLQEQEPIEARACVCR